MFATVRNQATTPAARTKIVDISSVGTTLSDAEIRLVSGGGGETSTADNNTCDMDGTPSPKPSGGSGYRLTNVLITSYSVSGAAM